MKRQVELKDISDGRLYDSEDMVRADCGDCKGCHACCCGSGDTIILDPMDVMRLSHGLGKSFAELLGSYLELGMMDGMILPSMRMEGADQHCVFLNEEGRCSVHSIRPGFCRLFPLARYYENGRFWYILQTHECPNQQRSKIKVRQWLDTPNLKAYEKFNKDWHDLLQALAECGSASEEDAKAVNYYMLRKFYQEPYGEDEDFYPQFEQRLAETKESFGI